MQILLLDKEVNMAFDNAYDFYQKDSSPEHRGLYEMLARLKNILDTVNQEGLIENSPEYYQASLIFRELGNPQAQNIYLKKRI